jgi:hypothetical protein
LIDCRAGDADGWSDFWEAVAVYSGIKMIVDYCHDDRHDKKPRGFQYVFFFPNITPPAIFKQGVFFLAIN